jgi:hypothetical protein
MMTCVGPVDKADGHDGPWSFEQAVPIAASHIDDVITDDQIIKFTYRVNTTPTSAPSGFKYLGSADYTHLNGLRVDFLRNTSTGELIVATRGSENTENWGSSRT